MFKIMKKFKEMNAMKKRRASNYNLDLNYDKDDYIYDNRADTSSSKLYDLTIIERRLSQFTNINEIDENTQNNDDGQKLETRF